METIAESISSFAHVAQQANEQPEEPIFALTSSQLQDLITQAVEKAIQPLKDLRVTVTRQDEKMTALEATEDTLGENDLNQLRLIADLRHKAPGKTELSRSAKIETYLLSRPDHKATFETLRGHLGIDKVLLSQVVKSLMVSSPGRYTTLKARGNKRILVMLPSS
jgi:hypothetical protein